MMTIIKSMNNSEIYLSSLTITFFPSFNDTVATALFIRHLYIHVITSDC